MAEPATTISDILAAQGWAATIAEAEQHLQQVFDLDKREIVRAQTSLVTRHNAEAVLDLTPFSRVSGPNYIGQEPGE